MFEQGLNVSFGPPEYPIKQLRAVGGGQLPESVQFLECRIQLWWICIFSRTVHSDREIISLYDDIMQQVITKRHDRDLDEKFKTLALSGNFPNPASAMLLGVVQC
jgi:hypothetical protein